MLPAALPPRAGEDFVQRLPEAKGTIADRKFRRDLQSAPANVDQKFAPALGAFADADLKADQLFLALGRRADQNQHALAVVLHPGLQEYAIGQT